MQEVNQKELGKRIKSGREKLNMSQFALYKKTGISTTQISGYENGKKSVGLHTLAKIASALGLSLDELYYGSTNSKPISTATDKGELIVNCFYVLYEQGVVCSLLQQKGNGYVGADTNYYYKIGFSEYVDILDDLVLKLDDFQMKRDDYPDPDGFKEQLLAAAAKQINSRTERPTIKKVGV